MQQISYRGQAAVMVGRERFWLVDELAELPVEDPVRVWVSWLCVYARDVLNGLQPGPWSQQRAERFAREVLLPEEEFIAVAYRPEQELADNVRRAARAGQRSPARPRRAAARAVARYLCGL